MATIGLIIYGLCWIFTKLKLDRWVIQILTKWAKDYQDKEALRNKDTKE